MTHLPVIIDPPCRGQAKLVPALSKAAVAVGADGIIVEVHPCRRRLHDGAQSLTIEGSGKYAGNGRLHPVVEDGARGFDGGPGLNS